MLRFDNLPALFLLLIFPLKFILRRAGLLQKPSLPLILADWQGKPFEYKAHFSSFIEVFSKTCGVFALICLIFALSKPVLSTQKKVFTSKGAEIIFVIDTSPSMAAKDMQGSHRLDAAKQCIEQFTNQIQGASFGLVAMAQEAALVVPVTLDQNYFLSRLHGLQIGELGDGTAIGTGLATALVHCTSSKAPKKCIVLITDGENNAGSVHPQTAASLAKQNSVALYVLGIGTRGKVQVEYVDPKSGKNINGFLDSDFDENQLFKLAVAGGGAYFSAENTVLLANVLKNVAAEQNVQQTYRVENINKPLYSYFLLCALALFSLCWLLRRVYLKEI